MSHGYNISQRLLFEYFFFTAIFHQFQRIFDPDFSNITYRFGRLSLFFYNSFLAYLNFLKLKIFIRRILLKSGDFASVLSKIDIATLTAENAKRIRHLKKPNPNTMSSLYSQPNQSSGEKHLHRHVKFVE